MENFDDKNETVDEEVPGTPAILKKLSTLIAEQTKEMDAKISELSHLNEAETGYNPTPAELASVYQGIKAQIEGLGEKP